MNAIQKNCLRYFRNTLELDRLQTVEYSKNSGPFWTIPADEFESGVLSAEVTKEIVDTYHSDNNIDKSKQEKTSSVDLIVSTRAIKNGTKVFGALNFACSLSRETGELAADTGDGGPWIPNNRLSTPNSEPMDIMVGKLEDFWKFNLKHKEELESKIETWSDYLAYADKLFTFVNDGSNEPLEGALESYAKNEVYLTIGKNIVANGAIISLYDYLLRRNEIPGILSTMMAPTPTNAKMPAEFVDQNEQMVYNMLALCGSMRKQYPLADSQRTAVHAFTKMNAEEVLAVSGPPGTGKTTMLQAIVASLITSHALEGKNAPVIIGSSATSQAVTNIIVSFSGVASEEHGPLDYRWLLMRDQEPQSDTPKTLPGIAAYCPRKSRLAEEKKKYLVEQADKTGVYSEYSDEEYLARAEKAFFEFANQLCGQPSDNLKNIQATLRSALVALDNARRSLIQAASSVIPLTTNSLLEQQCDSAESLRRSAQERLQRWMDIDEQRPRKGLFHKPASTDEDLIYANKSNYDSFPNTLTTLEGVKSYYKQLIDQQDIELAKIQQMRTNYDSAERAYATSFESVLALLRKWTGDDELVDRFAAYDVHAGDGFLGLDRILDTTVRYVEFWLSIHYYECQWLIDCSSKDTLIPKNELWKKTKGVQDKYWSQIASVTPCLVMTEFQLPKYFTLYGGKERPNKYDLGRIDLMIVDEAGQVNTPVALASFALAQKAVVVGDIQQLSPVWPLSPEADEEIAKDNGVPVDDWNERADRGLTASQPSSLMRAAASACIWRNSDDDAGLFLEEHYRCVPGIIQLSNSLLYGGRLIPSRPPKNKLENLVDSPFIFHEVPGSKDIPAGSSRKNQIEADAIIEWLEHNSDVLQDRYDLSIENIVGIVTPFKAQAGLIKATLQNRNPALAKELTIGTAHSLQGAERPVILFSAVYGDESGEAGFMERTPELTNVAVSRAKDLFIVFGSKKRLEDSGKVLMAIKEVATIGDGNLTEAAEHNNQVELDSDE